MPDQPHKPTPRPWAVLVRVGVPVVIGLAGLILIGAGGSVGARAMGLALLLVAGVVIFANWLFRFGLDGAHDRDAEAESRERYLKTGRWG